MKLIKSITKSLKFYFYGILFYLNIENNPIEFQVSRDSEKSKKKSRRWSRSEKIVAAYLALYGYPKSGEITENLISYVLKRSDIALRRKISKYKYYEKTGDSKHISADEIDILCSEYSLSSVKKNKRTLSKSLFIAGRENNRQDISEIQEAITSIFASSYSSIKEESLKSFQKN